MVAYHDNINNKYRLFQRKLPGQGLIVPCQFKYYFKVQIQIKQKNSRKAFMPMVAIKSRSRWSDWLHVIKTFGFVGNVKTWTHWASKFN